VNVFDINTDIAGKAFHLNR